jgi:RNA polymerase sigma factor (sigma-70 family)
MSFFNNGDDSKIVKGCLQHDRYWQKKLFDRYKDGMYTVVFRILRNQAQASDAVQEGFIQAFTCIQHYRFESSLGSWIKTIMIRCAVKILKKESFYAESNEEDIPDTWVEWDENLTGELLDKAISLLSPGFRSVFLLVEVEGYSHKEVAGLLNISEGTSKSQLSRAKVILQQKLKELRY